MGCICIPYTRVPKSSALFLDYLYHYDRVAGFYNGPPFELESYRKVAGQLAGLSSPRRELAEILTRQNKAFGCAGPTFENIRKLAEPGTFAVVSGQQVGLFSGPVFTLYKALTAVRLARYLSEEGLPSAPVFWLATEDHDLEEVAETAVFNEEYDLVPLKDSGLRTSPRSPVGHVKLTEETGALLARLESLVPAGEPREELLRDLRSSYQPGAGWGLAFGKFMARLFSRWGVVLLDSLDEAVHGLARGVFETAIGRAGELRARLKERSEALLRAGYHVQVRVGDDSTLVFVMRNGDRVALAERGGEFELEGIGRMDRSELEALRKQRPLELSPNVLLRPLLQDALLPTLAYIAGPSELAYLGQAQALYGEIGRPQPVIFPRAGFTLIERRVQRVLEKYGLGLEDVWQGEEHLTRRLGEAAFSSGGAEGWSGRFDQSERELAALLERLEKDIEVLDPTLLDSLKNAREKMTYQLERLRGKLSRAAVERSGLLARHHQMLLRSLAPEKDLQERRVSGISFLARAGYDLLELVLAQIQTHSSDHQVIVY